MAMMGTDAEYPAYPASIWIHWAGLPRLRRSERRSRYVLLASVALKSVGGVRLSFQGTYHAILEKMAIEIVHGDENANQLISTDH